MRIEKAHLKFINIFIIFITREQSKKVKTKYEKRKIWSLEVKWYELQKNRNFSKILNYTWHTKYHFFGRVRCVLSMVFVAISYHVEFGLNDDGEEILMLVTDVGDKMRERQLKNVVDMFGHLCYQHTIVFSLASGTNIQKMLSTSLDHLRF